MNTFAKRPDPSDYAKRDEMNRRAERLAREARLLDPKRAHQLAHALLEDVLADGMSYADFESAQAATKYTRKACNALRGLA